MSSVEHIAAWSLSDAAQFRSPLALRQARLVTLDSIGCMLVGHQAETPRKIIEWVEELGGRPDCSIVGTKLKTNVLNATLGNCVLVRGQDLNDVMFIQKEGHLSVGGHCSDNIPAALAVAEFVTAPWSAVFETLVMGYELFVRMRDVMPFSSNWDGASVSGLVAAAMAGRLMKFDVETQAHAIAFGATRCSTPKIVRWGELASIKNLAGAMIAESAVGGAMMAARGLTGPLEILDHKGGLQQVFDPALDFSRIWETDSSHANIMLANVKTYPCIGTGQTAVAAAIAAHKRVAGRIDQIQKIVVTMADVPMVRNQQAEESRRYPLSREDADHSFTFLPAVALVDGEVTERQFENDRWATAQMRHLAGIVELECSSDLARNAPGSMPCKLCVVLKDGEEIEEECLYPPGHSCPDRGLDSAVVESKFRHCASGILPAATIERVIVELLKGDGTTSPAEMMPLLSS